jgi:hypothetical protein
VKKCYRNFHVEGRFWKAENGTDTSFLVVFQVQSNVIPVQDAERLRRPIKQMKM